MRRRDFLAVSGGALATGLLPQASKAVQREGDTFGNIRHGEDFYKIDAFSHFVPIAYLDYLQSLGGPPNSLRAMAVAVPEHSDIKGLDPRLQMMEDEQIDLAIVFPPTGH